MLLYDLFTHDALQDALDRKLVRREIHPGGKPLAILNYTDNATFDREWNDVTRACRGLIYDTISCKIVARPFPKFFNHGEPDAPPLDLDEPCTVADKVDGSLGILYPLGVPNWLTGHPEYHIATRGSFTSDQAKHATAVWRERYEPFVEPPAGWTLLFEIVYPRNRVVVDYRDMDDLVLLGAVHINTGQIRPAAELPRWLGPRVEEFPHATLRDALAADPRPGREGLVVRYDDGRMVKIKQDDYKAMHRILTGCTARHLWEFMAVHAVLPHVALGPAETDPVQFLVRKLRLGPDRVREILAAGPDWQHQFLLRVPEEFRAWAAAQIVHLRLAAQSSRTAVYDLHRKTFADLPESPTRWQIVQAARKVTPEHWRLVMAIHDGEELESWCWYSNLPDHELPAVFDTEKAGV